MKALYKTGGKVAYKLSESFFIKSSCNQVRLGLGQ